MIDFKAKAMAVARKIHDGLNLGGETSKSFLLFYRSKPKTGEMIPISLVFFKCVETTK